MVIGSRPPSAASRVLAPIFSSGSSTRFIGRDRSEASPSSVAVIGEPASAPSASRQPVPELPKSSGARGRSKAADPDAAHPPGAVVAASDLRAQGAHRVGGAVDVLAFQQAGNGGLADRQRAQNERPMRDRFIARHPDTAGQRAASP